MFLVGSIIQYYISIYPYLQSASETTTKEPDVQTETKKIPCIHTNIKNVKCKAI